VWLALSQTGALAPGSDVAATSLAWYDELRTPDALVAGLHETGFDESTAWAITDQVRVLLALPRPSQLRGSERTVGARLLDAWLASDTIRVAVGLNTWEGIEYVDRDKLAATLRWAIRLDTIERDEAAPRAADSSLVEAVLAAAAAAGYGVEALRAELAATPPARSSATPRAPAKRARPKTGSTRPPRTPEKPKARRTRREKTD